MLLFVCVVWGRTKARARNGGSRVGESEGCVEIGYRTNMRKPWGGRVGWVERRVVVVKVVCDEV